MAREWPVGSGLVGSVPAAWDVPSPAISPGVSRVNPVLARRSWARSSLTRIHTSPPDPIAINVSRLTAAASALRMALSVPNSRAPRRAPSSTRSSNDKDGGVSPRTGSDAKIATTLRVTFNSPGSSISASQRSSATAGTGIRRASRGMVCGRPGCTIYATDSS